MKTVIEGPGRYVVYATPDGGWLVARAGPLCETCANCGCGDQGEPIQIPAMVLALAQSQGRNIFAKLKAMKKL